MDNPHESRTAPAVSGVIDLDGTEMGAPGSAAPAGSIRSFRAGGSGLPAPDAPAVEDDKHTRADHHAGHGHADERRGLTTVLRDASGAAVEQYNNQRTAVVLTPEDPPARPRGGFTGADPTRPALMIRPSLIRWFDKAIAEHPGPVLKVEQAGPLAARPKDGLADVSGAQPFAGGATGTQREGIGPGRNSFRIMPKPWDALLVDTGGPAVSATNPDPAYTAAVSQARRGFRA